MSNGILDNQLPNSTLGLGGQTPATRAGAKITSTLHNQSSLNDIPAIDQSPSDLDLDGQTPGKYLDNPPG
jgi:hypothetical protein|tara:strand:- start:176 stop:385 length:210 start_codon:yes stop_codon:yes gene_type:complete